MSDGIVTLKSVEPQSANPPTKAPQAAPQQVATLEPIAPTAEVPPTSPPEATLPPVLEVPTAPTSSFLAPFQAEYAEKGALSPDSYKALENAGVPKATVDAYIEGQKALMAQATSQAEQATKAVNELVGGEQGWRELSLWARDNMSAAEAQALNASLASDDLNTVLFALKSLKAQHALANPSMVTGTSGNPAGSYAFDSQAQWIAHMQARDARGNKLYDTDPAYREENGRRLAASKGKW